MRGMICNGLEWDAICCIVSDGLGNEHGRRCTFNEFMEDTSYAPWFIDGHIGWKDGSFKFRKPKRGDLTFAQAYREIMI